MRNGLNTKHARIKRIALILGCLAIAAYAGICVWMKVNEQRLVFHDNPKITPVKQSLGLQPQWVQIGSSGDLPLHAWLIHCQPEDGSNLWALYFHGNGSNVTTWWNQREYHKQCELGFNVLAPEFPGFGRAPGKPSEDILRTQARAAFDYLTQTTGVPNSRIVIWGESLGSGAAVDLATQTPAAALVLVAPFSSLVKSAAARYPLLPVSLLASNRFESDTKMDAVRMPVFITHSVEDAVIPFADAEKLYALARDPKHFETAHGPHATHGYEFYRALSDFLTSSAKLPVRSPRPSIGSELAATLEKQGSEAAIARYRELKTQQPDSYNFAEYELEDLGYELLSKQQYANAIAIMTLNSEQFPNSFESYDSLGEAYLRSGDKKTATEKFRRSLEVYPAEDNYSRQKLEELEAGP